MQRTLRWFFGLLLPVGLAACGDSAGSSLPGQQGASEQEVQAAVDPGPPLYTFTTTDLTSVPPPRLDPVVVGGCRLSVVEKEEVPSEKDGILLFIGTDLTAEDQNLPADQLIDIKIGGEAKRFRKLKEGDSVKPGQLLARLDDRVARDEWAKKKQGVVTAQADLQTAEATRDEALARYESAKGLVAKRAISQEEYRAARLNWERYQHEVTSKAAAIEHAKLEARQAETVLGMHEIRSAIHGQIRHIAKQPGEAIKSAPSYEALFELLNLDRLRVEGRLPVQFKPRLRVGQEVVVEATRSSGPRRTLIGHLQEVTGVAVARDQRILSSSLDKTVRIWDRETYREQHILKHSAPVLSVACTSTAAKLNRCASGASDGTVRLWDLERRQPGESVLDTKHQGSVNCVAFSPDGHYFASGGDDRDILVWETATGKLLYHLKGHSGAVTSLRFTPKARLVSAGRDNTLCIWQLGTQGGKLLNSIDRRSGDVSTLDVTSDGQHVLFDPWQSKHLRVLSVPDGLTNGTLRYPGDTGRFTGLAQFSPDGELIVTAGNSEGRLDLWRSPLRAKRARVLRELVPDSVGQVTSAAFSPDGTFLVSGTRERQVLVWDVPAKEQLDETITARITYIDSALDVASNQIRIWAELDNRKHRLMPGDSATLVRFEE